MQLAAQELAIEFDQVIEDDKQPRFAARRASPGNNRFGFSLAESEQRLPRSFVRRFQRRKYWRNQPGDARRALMFVAFSDFFEFSSSFFKSHKMKLVSAK